MFGAEAAWHHLCTFERHHSDRWPLVPGVLLQVQTSFAHHTPTLLPRAAQTHTEVACGEREEECEQMYLLVPENWLHSLSDKVIGNTYFFLFKCVNKDYIYIWPIQQDVILNHETCTIIFLFLMFLPTVAFLFLNCTSGINVFQTKLFLYFLTSMFNCTHLKSKLTNQLVNQPNSFLIYLCPHHSVGCHGDQKTREALPVKEVSVWRKWWSDWFSSLLLGSLTPSALRTLRASPCLKSNIPWSDRAGADNVVIESRSTWYTVSESGTLHGVQPIKRGNVASSP